MLCLLSNAVKYSDGGTVNVIIELLEDEIEDSVADNPSRFGDEGSRVSIPSIRISIEDIGIGLSEKTRKTLFQPFRQAQRIAGGTGLGLLWGHWVDLRVSLNEGMERKVPTFGFRLHTAPMIRLNLRNH
jgi:signal transduction histidine kinase